MNESINKQKLPEKPGNKKGEIKKVEDPLAKSDPLFLAKDKNSDSKIECLGCGYSTEVGVRCPNCDLEN